MINKIDLFDQGGVLRLIAGTTETVYVDLYEKSGIPADLSDAEAFFHFMTYSTRCNVWTKKCDPTTDLPTKTNGVDYPYIVPLKFHGDDTKDLDGHFIGQLELIDHNGDSVFPFEIEVIVRDSAR